MLPKQEWPNERPVNRSHDQQPANPDGPLVRTITILLVSTQSSSWLLSTKPEEKLSICIRRTMVVANQLDVFVALTKFTTIDLFTFPVASADRLGFGGIFKFVSSFF